MVEQESKLLSLLAQSWNNLDISFIEKKIAKNIIYKSELLENAIEGDQIVLSYLNSKFEALRLAIKLEPMTLIAELGLNNNVENKLCIILTQITNAVMNKVFIFITVEKNKIVRIEIRDV